MTCRCNMCGFKNAGKYSRNSYARLRLFGDESRKHSDKKDRARKIRRVREKRQWKAELLS